MKKVRERLPAPPHPDYKKACKLKSEHLWTELRFLELRENPSARYCRQQYVYYKYNMFRKKRFHP